MALSPFRSKSEKEPSVLIFARSKFRRLQGFIIVLVKSEVMINQSLRVAGNPFQQSTFVEGSVGHKAHVLGLFPDKLVAFAGFGNLLVGRLFILLDLADGKISQTQVSGGYLLVVRKVTNELLEQPNGVRVVVLGTPDKRRPIERGHPSRWTCRDNDSLSRYSSICH